MTLDDICPVKITDEMILQAKADAKALSINYGKGTRDVSPDRDITGSLAHQAVEKVLEHYGKDFQTLRTKIYHSGGDKGDIIYGKDLIDVKGTKGFLDESWYFNKNFLVFQDEIPKMKWIGITHLIFVVVDIAERIAFIYGVIDFCKFLEEATPLKLNYDNQCIKANKLVSIFNYLNIQI